MNKKILILGLSLLLSIAIVHASIEFSNEIPENSSVIDGNNETLFQVDVNESGIDWGEIIIDGEWYTINCFDTVSGATCDRPTDLTGYMERGYEYYFLVLRKGGWKSPTYYFTIDRVPIAPTGLEIISSDEESLHIDWDNNTELDIIGYTIYISDVPGIDISDNSTYGEKVISLTSDYVIGGLSISDVKYCVVTATDNGGKESEASNEVNGTVKDATPPESPTIIPETGSEVNMTNPTIIITYNEIVTLDIITAGEVMVSNEASMIHTWNPNFRDNTTYVFTLNATDANGNTRNDTYIISIRTGALFNIEIKGMEHASYDFFPIKTSILAGDYILFGIHANFYTFTEAEQDKYLRYLMKDWISPEATIDIEDMEAIAFCEDDYDEPSQNIKSEQSYNVYKILDGYTDEPALNCPDNTPTVPDVEFTFYVKANIPPDVKPGTYTFKYGINTYPEE